MKTYNRTPINSLDPRQCVYVEYHDEHHGTDQLIINGKTYEQRIEESKLTNTLPDGIITDAEAKVLAQYSDREAYRLTNKRGNTIIFRTEKNESMYRWEMMEKIQ